jgi:hypothetical protein
LRRRIFLLSPANASGERARLLLNERAQFDLAVKLRHSGAPLGDLYAFVSGLYFRGKLAYATAFAAPPEGLPGCLVITPNRGLVPPHSLFLEPEFRAMSGIPVDPAEPRYLMPLQEHAHALRKAAGPDCAIILLGSIASAKYVNPLLETFGDQLQFPAEFIGRGDMSRGVLLLRCASSGD